MLKMGNYGLQKSSSWLLWHDTPWRALFKMKNHFARRGAPCHLRNLPLPRLQRSERNDFTRSSPLFLPLYPRLRQEPEEWEWKKA